MPFFKIKDKYTFLHLKNYSKLNDIALKDKSDSWRFSSKIARSKESEEALKLRRKTIHDIYKNTNFDDFYKEWIYFDLGSHDYILEDLPYLLFDYGCINRQFGHGRVPQEVAEELFPDLYYDKDCVYEIALFSKKRLFKKTEVIFSTMINTSEILSVKGELNDFTIAMKNRSIHFGKSITVKDKT